MAVSHELIEPSLSPGWFPTEIDIELSVEPINYANDVFGFAEEPETIDGPVKTADEKAEEAMRQLFLDEGMPELGAPPQEFDA